jgi:hypothetical protein
MDPRYDQTAMDGDSEYIETPTRISDWILSIETHEVPFRAGHGTTPDLIYARGVPETPSPDQSTLDRKKCNLIFIEVRFYRDFGYHEKLQKKTTKYAPLVNALKAEWGKVEFVADPIGHAGTTLSETQRHLAQVLSATRHEIERNRARRVVKDPNTDASARAHDSSLFKTRMQALTKLAHTKLLGIIYHRQSLVHAQVGEVRRTRSISDATPT